MTVFEGSLVQPSSNRAAGSMPAIWQRFTATVCSVLLVFVFLYYVDVAYVVSLSTSQAFSTATAIPCSSAPHAQAVTVVALHAAPCDALNQHASDPVAVAVGSTVAPVTHKRTRNAHCTCPRPMHWLLPPASVFPASRFCPGTPSLSRACCT